MTEPDPEQHWYARRGANILGPYTPDELSRYILLGRVRLSDRISADGHTWYRLADRSDLIPEAMNDLDTPEGRARFEAARREADERSHHRSRLRRRREDKPERWGPRRPWLAGTAVVAVMVVLALIGWRLDFGPVPGTQPDCSASAAANVDWSYCIKEDLVLAAGTDLTGLMAVNASLRGAELAGVRMRGASLAHADLTGANLESADLARADLEGADLRGARLANASLAGASLRHADLRGADLAGVDIDDADLSGAAWAVGDWCRHGSIGECRR